MGTQGHRQLLVDLEAVGTLTVSGPPADVEAWIRAVVLELGAGDDLADASVLTVGCGVDGVEHLERVADVQPDEAVKALTTRTHEVTNLVDGDSSLFHRRLGESPLLGLSTAVVVGGDIELAVQAEIAACVVGRHGAAAVLTADIDHPGARVVLQGRGSAVLHGIGPTRSSSRPSASRGERPPRSPCYSTTNTTSPPANPTTNLCRSPSSRRRPSR